MPLPTPLLLFSKDSTTHRSNNNTDKADFTTRKATSRTGAKNNQHNHHTHNAPCKESPNRTKVSPSWSKANVVSLIAKKGLTNRTKARNYSKQGAIERTGSSMTVMESSMLVEKTVLPVTNDHEGTPVYEPTPEDEEEETMDRMEAAASSGPAAPGITATALSTYDVTNRDFVDPLKRKGRYTGMVKVDTNRPHGTGRMEYFADQNTELDQVYVDSNGASHSILVISYDGQWINGDWCGYGTLILEVQNKALGTKRRVKYQGGFFDNMKHGQGILWYSESGDDVCFDGLFQLDKMGRGVMKYKDGSSYWGDFASSSLSNTSGKKDTCSTTIDYNSYYYYYDFESTKPHGRGKYVYPDGTIFDGEFECGIMHGHGRMTYTDGSWYLGEWSEGKKNGFGIQVSRNGSLIHEGIFYRDQPIHGSSIPHRQRKRQSEDHLHNSLAQESRDAGADLSSQNSSSSLPTDFTAKTEDDSSSSSIDEILLYRSSLVAKPQSAGVVRAGKASTLVGPIPQELVMRKRLI